MPKHQSTQHTHDVKQRDPRFGVRIPADGRPAPFRVLISMRWLQAGLITALAGLLALTRLPRHFRLPSLYSASLGGIALMLAGLMQARRLVFEHLELPIKGLPQALDGFTIIQLTDLHLGSPFTVANTQRAVAWAHEQQPDLIVFTGDFVSFTDKIPLLHNSLQGISARYGVYAILGNHDYWVDLRPLLQILDGHGITLLRNDQRRIDVENAALHLVGIDCVWEGRHDLNTALRDLPADETVIVLAHEPDIADEVAAYDVALQLSGHTHAGHVALPVLGPLFLPRHGFRYFRGLQRINGMWLYVSRGLGGFPLRIGAPPEATRITLKASDT